MTPPVSDPVATSRPTTTCRKPSRALAPLACAAVLLATACGGTDSGTAKPITPSTGQNADDSAARHGAPPVPAPLDVSGIVQTPCKALTDKQVQTFPGTLEKTHITTSTGTGEAKACAWSFEGDRYSMGTISGGVVLPSAQYHGISSIYKSKQHGNLDAFREVGPIAGYPAVIYGSGRAPGDGWCRLAVGLRNDTAYRIEVGLLSQSPHSQKPCTDAKQLAKYIVTNLKDAA